MTSYETIEEPELPSSFTCIKKVKELGNELTPGKKLFVNVIGFVTDWLCPRKTSKDWKCTFRLKDLSIPDGPAFSFYVFGPEETLPNISAVNVADVILIRQAKVQMMDGSWSLLSHFSTQYFVATLPQNHPMNKQSQRSSDLAVKWHSYSVAKGPSKLLKQPTPAETAYAIKANLVKDISLPTEEEFNRKVREAETAVYRKEKFKNLKDVQLGDYCDIIGEVIRVYPQEGENLIQVYLSDYTAHKNFYDYKYTEDQEPGEVDRDEYGYTRNRKSDTKSKEWPGPYGKLSIQISVWGPHANYILNKVEAGQWISLKNVHIEPSKNDSTMEGKLREDRNASEGKIQVSILDDSENLASSDPNLLRWKDAVGRKRDWWKKHKRKQEEKQGGKRKHDGAEPLKLNGKQRRMETRAALNKKIAESNIQVAEKLDLNENVLCGFSDTPVIPLKVILEPQQVLLPQEHRGPLSPFTNCKYRVHVRVVDYFPERVEDFAVGRRATDMDILSDYSGGEDTDPEEDVRHFRSGKGFYLKKWEWRFALQVVDASSKTANEKIWLLVGNHAAQGLLGLEEDAANLRTDPELLHKVKEQLFKLWGDLEEQKSKLLPQIRPGKELPTSSMPSATPASSPPQIPGAQPDIDSDDENDGITTPNALKSKTNTVSERDPDVMEGIETTKSRSELAPKNKAFTCCIQQYGVKVEENDPAKANAGNGQRWQRMFGLFATHIK